MKLRIGNACWQAFHVQHAAFAVEAGFFAQEGIDAEIERMADLKGKAMGTSRYGAISDFAARFALVRNGLQPEKDVAILQTGGPSESVAALNTNRIQAVALTAPATIRARKLGLRPLLDLSKRISPSTASSCARASSQATRISCAAS